MNISDLQMNPVQGTAIGTDEMGNATDATGKFATLLQFLTNNELTVNQGIPDVSLKDSERVDVDGKSEKAVLLQNIQSLMDHPEMILEVLEQPEVSSLPIHSVKHREIVQILKAIQEGNIESAVQLLDQSSITPAQINTLIGNVLQKQNQQLKSEVNSVQSIGTAPVEENMEKLILPVKNELTPSKEKFMETGQNKIVNVIQKQSQEPSSALEQDIKANTAAPAVSVNRMNHALLFNSVNRTVPFLPVDEQIMNRIEAALKQAPFINGKDGSSKISIRLYPEQLGELVVQVDRKGNELTIKLFMANEQTKQLIEQQLGKLHTTLHQQSPVVKIETGIIATAAREFEQGFSSERHEQEKQESSSHQQEEEREEEEDDGRD
ncbi:MULTISPECIES: flagellar hook-length control protein FliK [unclassified Exiguobacterium]|uniref:flagellar hook-length control protein FliK n=1 Tax=unclassified Exiguobacterium TaxID=2644629 RepID=UPI001BECCACB|nr:MULTISPECIES: flagellar hook-length control protein FliK [unclassified Exiguobacterium]